MTRNPDRPLSPHLTVWRWGPHMAVSILHRISGVGLSTVGAAILVWWLYALAQGPEAYGTFTAWAVWPWALIVWIGLSWALIQHTLSGIRHFVMDVGAGYEIQANKTWATIILVASVLLTAALWWWIIFFSGRLA